MKKHLFGLVIGIVCSYTSFSQNISGSWFGVGKVENQGTGNSYLTELSIIQKGKNITGTINYYFRDSLFAQSVTGTFDATTRILKLSEVNFIFHKATNTETGIDCPMFGSFLLRAAKAEAVLIGSFYADKNFRFTCPEISFKLKKKMQDEETETDPVIPIVKEEKKDSTATTKTEEKNTAIDTISITEKKKKEEEFTKRGKTYLKEIIVKSNVLKLEFYDNGAIDYDSISVFLNDKLVLPKSKLDHKALKVTITLNESLPFNELSMFAESLGYIPPNTAALIIWDGTTRHDVLMTSDFNKTATIKLIKQP